MLKAYKYRINPIDEQKTLINKHLGLCRWLYNYALNKKITAYQKTQTNISRFALQAELPLLKKNPENEYIF